MKAKKRKKTSFHCCPFCCAHSSDCPFPHIWILGYLPPVWQHVTGWPWHHWDTLHACTSLVTQMVIVPLCCSCTHAANSNVHNNSSADCAPTWTCPHARTRRHDDGDMWLTALSCVITQEIGWANRHFKSSKWLKGEMRWNRRWRVKTEGCWEETWLHVPDDPQSTSLSLHSAQLPHYVGPIYWECTRAEALAPLPPTASRPNTSGCGTVNSHTGTCRVPPATRRSGWLNSLFAFSI